MNNMKTDTLKKLIKLVLKEHEESNMNNPEEKREVQIGRKIRSLADQLRHEMAGEDYKKACAVIDLADELVRIHTFVPPTRKSKYLQEGEAFTSDLGAGYDSISEGNTLDALNLTSDELNQISELSTKLAPLWKHMVKNQQNHVTMSELTNNLYSVVSKLEQLCKDIRIKIEPNLS